MYDTMVNLHTGPRVLGETFELHALPGTKNTPLDDMQIFASGFGGDPYNFAKLDFSKSKFYEFSGMFRRDRRYFDYDLLGNPEYSQRLFDSHRALHGADRLICMAAGESIAVHVQHRAPHDRHQPHRTSAVDSDIPLRVFAEQLAGSEPDPERQCGRRAGSSAPGISAQQHRRFYARGGLEAGAGHEVDL